MTTTPGTDEAGPGQTGGAVRPGPAGGAARAWRALTLLAAVFLVAFGAVVVRAGDLDDSPGLGGSGLVTAVIGLVMGVRALRRAR